MKEIITDLAKLMQAAKPIKFVSDDGSIDKEFGLSVINDLKEVFEANKDIVALSAPQIGIDARIIGIRFKDIIKFFINPVITKKLKYSIQGETCASMPGKEILISRPDEITVVYYTEDFKYEDNKLLGVAARLFDQEYQFLDGVVPSELGLVSDIEYDGSLSELTEDEFKQVVDIYKQFIKSKIATLEKDIELDPNLVKEYNSLKFTESVITGHAALVGADPKDREAYKKAQAVAAISLKNNDKLNKQINRAQLNSYLRKKGK